MKRFLCTLLFLSCLALPSLAQAYNADFDQILIEAREIFGNGKQQYERAREMVTQGLRLPNLSEAQTKDGKAFIERCNRAIGVRDRIEFTVDSLRVPAKGGRDSAGFIAGRPDDVKPGTGLPDWCCIERTADGYVYLQLASNPYKTPREAQVELTVKGVRKKAVLHVVQEPRPDTQKQLIIQTNPRSALITVEKFAPTNGLWERRLPSGEYRINVRTADNQYEPKDTVVVLRDDLLDDEEIAVNLTLRPLFSRIDLNVVPEQGFAFGAEHQPRISINGNVVVEPKEEAYYYEDDRPLMKYCLYGDGTIPVSAGSVSIFVSAPGFRSADRDVFAPAGETVPVTIELPAVTGELRLVDEGRAAEATVLLDGTPVGTVEQIAQEGKPVLIGDHSIVIEREGFVPNEGMYAVHIEEGKRSSVPVSMYGKNVLDVKTDPAGARILLDGDPIGFSPLEGYELKEIPGDPGHRFTLTIERDSFLTVTRSILADFSRPETFSENHRLIPTHRLKISADDSGLRVTVKDNRKDPEAVRYAEKVELPAEVELPYREEPYYVELFRGGSSAYRGKITFKDETSPKERVIPSWSQHYQQILGCDFTLLGAPTIDLECGDFSKGYHNYGSLSLGKLGFFDGYTSSVIHASMLFQSDSDVPLHVPNEGVGEREDYIINNAGYLPAISFFFINGEFRVGGAVSDYFDVDALFSYAWYPDFWKQLFKFSYVSGFDLFLGAELTTRLPWIDFNLKAGALMQPDMKAQIYVEGLNRSNPEKSFYAYKLHRPVTFVISLGFTFGGHDSKGNSIWRVF